MIQSDCHMHTGFSTDSEAPVRSMIDGALERGLKEICLTDHYDKDYPRVPDIEGTAFVFDTEEYFRTLAALREEYAGRITVRTGIEIGLQPHLGEFYRELIRSNPFDFVIGSAAVSPSPRLLRSSASREDSPCKLPSSIIFFLSCFRERFRPRSFPGFRQFPRFFYLFHLTPPF